MSSRSLSRVVAVALSAASLLVARGAVADPIPSATGATGLAWAAERTAAAEQQQRERDAQRLADLRQEMEQLADQVGADHPRLRQLREKLDRLRAAHERQRVAREMEQAASPAPLPRRESRVHPATAEEAALQADERALEEQRAAGRRARRKLTQQQFEEHLQQAVEHLQAAGMEDLAERVRLEGQRRNDAGYRYGARPPGMPWAQPSPAMPWAQRVQPQRPNDDVQRVVQRLAEAVAHIERRVRESEEIRHAVHEIQAHVGNLQREIDKRLDEIEMHLQRQARHAEEMIGERSEQIEETIEVIERHVDRTLDEVEQRLRELQEEE